MLKRGLELGILPVAGLGRFKIAARDDRIIVFVPYILSYIISRVNYIYPAPK